MASVGIRGMYHFSVLEAFQQFYHGPVEFQRQTIQSIHLRECLSRTTFRKREKGSKNQHPSTLGESGVGLGCAGSIDPAIRNIYPKVLLKKKIFPAAAFK